MSLLKASYILTSADIDGEGIAKEWSCFTESPVTVHLEFGSSFNQQKIIIMIIVPYVGDFLLIKSHRYEGASPWYALKVNRRILKFILNFTGSQCRSLRTGMMCSNLFVPVTTLAAAFCAFWTLCDRGKPIGFFLHKRRVNKIKLGIKGTQWDLKMSILGKFLPPSSIGVPPPGGSNHLIPLEGEEIWLDPPPTHNDPHHARNTPKV